MSADKFLFLGAGSTSDPGFEDIEIEGEANLAVYAAKIIGLRDARIRANVAALGPKKRRRYKERNLYEELRGEE